MTKPTLLSQCLAEMAGVFALTFIGAGVICTNAVAGGGSGLLGVALAHGIILSIVVSATMNISGGHINPAVTITMWVYRRIDNQRMICYVSAQLLGGIIAGGVLLVLFLNNADAKAAFYGTPHVAKSLGDDPRSAMFTAIGIELVLTFLLLFAIFGTAIDRRAPNVGGFGIGLTVFADILMGGPLTGASMNPARALGPGVWEGGVFGFNWDWLRNQLVYWVGPVAGGILAGWLYIGYILPPDQREVKEG